MIKEIKKRLRIWIYQKFGIGMSETEYLMTDKGLTRSIDSNCEHNWKPLESEKIRVAECIFCGCTQYNSIEDMMEKLWRS